jgi:hypothetical protein
VFGGIVKAGLDGFEQRGLVVFDGKQKVAVGVAEDLGQGSLAKQGIAGEQPEQRVMVKQLLQAVLQRLGFGGLAVGDGELGQTEIQVVRKDVEPMDRIALGVVPLLAGLAIDGGRDGRRGLKLARQPTREDVAELLQRALRQGTADRGGMRRLLSCEAQGVLEGSPMVFGPTLDAGQVGLAAEQAQKAKRQQGRIGVADSARLARVVDQGKGVAQGIDLSSHP